MHKPSRLIWATYRYFPERFGGTEVYVARAARALRRQGHGVSVVAGTDRQVRSPAGWIETHEAVHEATPVTFLALRTERLRWEELLRLESEELTSWWRRWLNQHPCDLVHLHGHSPVCSVSLVAAARLNGIPVAMSVHHPGYLCARGDFVQAWGCPCDGQVRVGRCSVCFGLTKLQALMAEGPAGAEIPSPQTQEGGEGAMHKLRVAASLPGQFRARMQSWNRLISQVNGWHAFSEEMRRRLILNGVPGERIRVIPHGVDPAPAPARVASGRCRVGYIGRFHPEKGVHLLIRAIERVPRDLPVQFFFYGQAGDQREERLQEQIVALAGRDPRVTLAGGFQPSEAAKIFSGLDALAVPSIAFETGPLVVLEAFQAGIPVIGSRWGGLASLVRDGVDGLLFPWGDAGALARCLERIATEPGLRERLRQRIRPPASMGSHAAALLEFYDGLLKNCR